MSKVKSKDSSAELAVRRKVHALGYRYRLHRRDLPGTPDLVFPSRRKVIFVHGCFWHRHPGCKGTTTPKTRFEYWTGKFNENIVRDQVALDQLIAAGWEVLIIWECETRHAERLTERLEQFLNHPNMVSPNVST